MNASHRFPLNGPTPHDEGATGASIPEPLPSVNGCHSSDPSDDGHGAELHETIVTNYRLENIDDGNKKRLIRVGLSQQSILAQVLDHVGIWPKVAGGVLFVEDADQRPRFLDNAKQLFAWLGSKLPSGDNRIHWQDRGESMVSQGQFFEYMRTPASQYVAVETSPHFPPMDGHYYMHAPVKLGDGSFLRRFLDLFNPLTTVDRDLMLALLASLVWGGPCGARPAWLITGPDQDGNGDRGVGKTELAKRFCERQRCARDQ